MQHMYCSLLQEEYRSTTNGHAGHDLRTNWLNYFYWIYFLLFICVLACVFHRPGLAKASPRDVVLSGSFGSF